MPTLQERAVLATLRCKAWSGQAHDADVSEEVSRTHRADLDAGRYSKQLISRKGLHPIQSAMNKARSTHRLLTLPWYDDGTGILTTLGYMAYVEQMRMCRLATEAAVEQTAARLPDLIDEARVRLGTMFDADEYPSVEDFRQRFGLDIEIRAVPASGDFRAGLDAAHVKRITQDIEKRTEQRLGEAMNEVFQRVAGVCGHMVERLRAYEPSNGDKAPKNSFRDTLVTNVVELADTLPYLNVSGDKRLELLQAQLKDQLAEHSPEVLRSSQKARESTADKAEKLLAKVQGYFA